MNHDLFPPNRTISKHPHPFLLFRLNQEHLFTHHREMQWADQFPPKRRRVLIEVRSLPLFPWAGAGAGGVLCVGVGTYFKTETYSYDIGQWCPRILWVGRKILEERKKERKRTRCQLFFFWEKDLAENVGLPTLSAERYAKKHDCVWLMSFVWAGVWWEEVFFFVRKLNAWLGVGRRSGRVLDMPFAMMRRRGSATPSSLTPRNPATPGLVGARHQSNTKDLKPDTDTYAIVQCENF